MTANSSSANGNEYNVTARDTYVNPYPWMAKHWSQNPEFMKYVNERFSADQSYWWDMYEKFADGSEEKERARKTLKAYENMYNDFFKNLVQRFLNSCDYPVPLSLSSAENFSTVGTLL